MKKKMQINKKKEERRGTQEKMLKVDKTGKSGKTDKGDKTGKSGKTDKVGRARRCGLSLREEMRWMRLSGHAI